jgi:uroporphyrinogen-III synthase
MEEALKDPKKDPPLAAMSPNATEAALRVVQSLFLRASWMPAIATDKIFCVGAPPT